MIVNYPKLDFSLAGIFEIKNINLKESSVFLESSVECDGITYKMLIKMTKDDTPGNFAYKIDFQKETADYKKLTEIAKPDELNKARSYAIHETLCVFDQIDQELNKSMLEHNSEAALAALPVNTEQRKKSTL
jgi:hypothetical protein